MLAILAAVAMLLVASWPIVAAQDLSMNYLNIGVILEPNDDISRKVISLAIQNANVELVKHNYKLQVKTETLEENSSFYAIRKACNLLQSGLVAIISPISDVPSRHISSLCSKFHIPHLVTNCRFPESLENYPMDIQLTPNCDQYAKIIYHFITQVESWSDMILIHSSDNCILKFEHLLNQYESRFKMRQWVHHDLKKNKQLLRELGNSKNYRFFLVDIPYWQITEFLIMASVHNMTDPQFSYIFTDWDANLVDIAAFKINNKVNITSFSILDQETIDHYEKTDANINSLLNSIIQMEKSSNKADIQTKFMAKPAILFDSISVLAKGLINLRKTRPLSVKQLKCSQNDTWDLGPSLLNAMTSAENVRTMTGTVVFSEKAQRENYNLSIMELSENGFQKGGFWADNRFTVFPKVVEPPIPDMIQIDRPLKVTTIATRPFLSYKFEEPEFGIYDTNIDAWEGFCIDLLNEIGQDLKLNFSIHLVKDKKYGEPVHNETNPDGSEKWNGMIGELISKQAELAVAPMTISYEREKVVDFTTPFMSLGLSILFLRPKKESPGLFSFLSPIMPNVWCYIIGAYIFVSFIIFFIAHITPYEWMETHPCDDNSDMSNQFNLLNSLWFSVGAIVRQGLEFAPQASSTRIAAGAWWFFSLIIMSTYTANLAAFLTVEQLILPINSVEDLAKQTKIKYGTLKGGASFTFFEKALIETYQNMFKFMKKNPDVFVDSTEDGVKKVQTSNGQYAFLLESVMNEFYCQRDCNLIRIGDLLDSKGYGIGFPTGSPLRDRMTESILQLQKSQIIPSLVYKWWNKMNISEPCNTKEQGSIPAALNVYQVGGVFLMLGVGFIIGALVAIIELYVDYRNKKYQWKMPFTKYLKKELQFAMRFMSSSKKPLHPKLTNTKSREKLLYLDPQSGQANDASAEISHLNNNFTGKTDNFQGDVNRRQVFTDIDSPGIERSEIFSSSRDALGSISNSKYLWGLNSNL